MLALQRAHQGVLQDKNGIDGNLLDPTVRSEQLPQTPRTFIVSSPHKKTIALGLSPHRKACTQSGRRRLLMACISFLSNVDSLSGSDTVTWHK